jgi:hypothetical protein
MGSILVAILLVVSSAGVFSSAAVAETKRDIQGVRLGMQRSELEEVLHKCKPVDPTSAIVLRCEKSLERIFEIVFTKMQPPRVKAVNLKFCSSDSLSEVTDRVLGTFGHMTEATVTPDLKLYRVPMDDHTVMTLDAKISDQLPCPAFSGRYELSLLDRDLISEDMDAERENTPKTPKF